MPQILERSLRGGRFGGGRSLAPNLGKYCENVTFCVLKMVIQKLTEFEDPK